jgi:hypothetical protein
VADALKKLRTANDLLSKKSEGWLTPSRRRTDRALRAFSEGLWEARTGDERRARRTWPP